MRKTPKKDENFKKASYLPQMVKKMRRWILKNAKIVKIRINGDKDQVDLEK